MLNYGYRTPQDVHDSIAKYNADSNFKTVPLDTTRYFTNGTQRPRFLGAFQPRLGFSYQIDEAGNTTVYGGWGIFYDRTAYDLTSQERDALQHPSCRINLKAFPADSNHPHLLARNQASRHGPSDRFLAAYLRRP